MPKEKGQWRPTERKPKTSIEIWRDRGQRERAEKRRARLREQLPMGMSVTERGSGRTLKRGNYRKLKMQEYNMVPDGKGGYIRAPKPKKKKKLFGDK